MGDRSSIGTALKVRLESITNANGYATDIQKVHYDDISMGLVLEPQELPAILLISGVDEISREGGCLRNIWNFEIQCWDVVEKTDSNMDTFCADVLKAIYANSAVGSRLAAFRDLHPSVYDVNPLQIDPDLNMIEQNRCYTVQVEVFYSSTLLKL